eukprot:sb/3465317/
MNYRVSHRSSRAECQLYGTKLIKYLFDQVYQSNATVHSVITYLDNNWSTMIRCEATTTNWTSEYRGPNTTSSGNCDMITKKCTEQRRVKWLTPTEPEREPRHHHGEPERAIVVTTYDCSTLTNLELSKDTCAETIKENMNYRAECQLYGTKLIKYLFDQVYQSNATVHSVITYLDNNWSTMIRELCKLDCFRPLTRELRFCVNDLPVQHILPGISHYQLQFIMYRSEELLCASMAKSKQVPETCAVYLDPLHPIYREVMKNVSVECSEEMSQWSEHGRFITCSDSCREYILQHITHRDTKPGCCLADVKEFEEQTQPWIEMMAPDVFRRNPLYNLVGECGVLGEVKSCTLLDSMHPVVIFVIVVISIFSAILVTGVCTFIVIFYRVYLILPMFFPKDRLDRC